MTRGDQPLDQSEQAPPTVGPGMALRQRDGERTTAGVEQTLQHGELTLGIGRVEIGDELDDAAARILHAERDAEELLL